MNRVRRYLLSRKTVGNLVVLALLGLWYVTLAPTVFGGPAAYVEVQGHSMDGTYRTGDLVVTKRQDSYRAGDIVAFEVTGGQVIHRITGGDGDRGYTLQGDNNPDPDPWHPTDEDVVGKAWMHFPQKAHLLDLPADPKFAGISAGFLTLVLLLSDTRPRKRDAVEDAAPEVDAEDEGAEDEGAEVVPLRAMLTIPEPRRGDEPVVPDASTTVNRTKKVERHAHRS